MTLVLPVNVRVIAVRSFGRTPLLRVSAAIISEDAELGVVKARAADFADDPDLAKRDKHAPGGRCEKHVTPHLNLGR